MKLLALLDMRSILTTRSDRIHSPDNPKAASSYTSDGDQLSIGIPCEAG